jgi:succinyl-CoA synthetase beta subunit
MRVGELFERIPEITELDINPLIVVEGKPIAVDGRIVI